MSTDTAHSGPAASSLHGMSHHWANRGYREPSQDNKDSQVEDDKGEEAYQRCFAEAAKMQPPRVPNAAFFENSPSAMEYLKKRDRELFSQRETTFDPEQRQRNPNFVPHPKDLHRASRASLSPSDSGSQPQPLINGASRVALPSATSPTATTSPSIQARPPPSRPADDGQRFADPRYYQDQSPTLPMILEPQFGPTGPGRMLR